MSEPSNARLRIAFVTNLFPPIQTGSAYWTREAVTALAARGNTVIVITCGPQLHETVEFIGDVRVYRLPRTVRLPKWMIFLRFDQFFLMASRRNARRMREIIRDERIEIIHQAGHLLDSTVLSIDARRVEGVPAVCSIHTRIGHPTSAIYDLLLRGIDRFVLGPLLMRRFDRLIALDAALRQHYQRLYRVDDIEIVPVCIEDRILDEEPAPPVDGDPVRFMSVGHVTGMRDRRELLLAVAELKRRGLPVHLEIVGKLLTDVTPRMIEELDLRDTVTLLGEVPRGDLLRLLRSASLETHWIDIQGIGLAAMEAMAIGVPVAAWAYEGIYGDVPLKHLENIVFIDPHDREALVNTFELLVGNRELRQRIGSNGRELVRGYLTWSVVATRLEQVYSVAISARQN